MDVPSGFSVPGQSILCGSGFAARPPPQPWTPAGAGSPISKAGARLWGPREHPPCTLSCLTFLAEQTRAQGFNLTAAPQVPQGPWDLHCASHGRPLRLPQMQGHVWEPQGNTDGRVRVGHSLGLCVQRWQRQYFANKVYLVKAMVFPVIMHRCESWTIKVSTEELMLLNCGVGKDSWESFGLQGDLTSPS